MGTSIYAGTFYLTSRERKKTANYFAQNAHARERRHPGGESAGANLASATIAQ